LRRFSLFLLNLTLSSIFTSICITNITHYSKKSKHVKLISKNKNHRLTPLFQTKSLIFVFVFLCKKLLSKNDMALFSLLRGATALFLKNPSRIPFLSFTPFYGLPRAF